MEKHEDSPIEKDPILTQWLNSEVPPDVDRRLRGRLAAFRERLDSRGVPAQIPWWSFVARSRLALAGAAGLVLMILLGTVLLGNPRPTWAKVVESFRAVPFFQATLYLKEDALAEPQQWELWMGHGGKSRLRIGSQVIFGEKGRVVKAFDLKTRITSEPDRRAVQTLENLGASEQFSLETVLRAFPSQITISGPLLNEAAGISEDLTVFDITNNEHASEWARIWVLRASQLPVRVTVWDPRDGESVDALFSYSKRQPAEFFDPDAFAKIIANRSESEASLAYALLKDPGGRPLTPEDLFQRTGYHMPEIEDVGMTEDGIVWVIARKSGNRRPQGGTFWGFSELKDDLGREYVTQKCRYWSEPQDRSFDLYIPLDYGQDKRIPSVLTFVCTEDDYPREPKGVVVGTVDVKEWKKNTTWDPKLYHEDYWHPLLSLAVALKLRKNWDRAEQILALVPGEPETNKRALNRECVRIEILMGLKKYAEVVGLGQRLVPLICDQVYGPADRPMFTFECYTASLAALGRKEEIRPILKDVLGRLTPNTQKKYDQNVGRLVLQWQQFLSLEEIGDLLGFDVTKDPRMRQWGIYQEFPAPGKP